MAQIKLIDKDTDLSHLKRPVGWDLEIRGIPFDVYRVDGYIHTIGGKFGENCYWACPAGEKPSYKNLIEFNGDAPTWGITFDRNNSLKTKWGETEVLANGECWITRNGKKFYHVPARYLEYGLAKAQYVLTQLLEECPLWLAERNWKKNAIGRKVWYKNQPAKIIRILEDNELWIEPDGIDKFKRPVYWDAWMEWEDYADGLRVDLLSNDIYWFRD